MPDTKQQTLAAEAATARPDATDLEHMPVDQVLFGRNYSINN
jgi:hypothetical protein